MNDPNAAVTLVTAILSGGTISAILVPVISWILRRKDAKDAKTEDGDPLREGVRVLLFCKLRQIQQETVSAGDVCDVETKQTAQKVYDAYHGLGGNGVGTQMKDDILAAKIEPPHQPADA